MNILRLTPTEKKVLNLACEGFTGPEIASRLGMKYSTMKHHLENIYFKRNVHSRTELIVQELGRRHESVK